MGRPPHSHRVECHLPATGPGIAAALGVLGYLLLPDYTAVRTMSLWVFIASLLAVMLIGAKRDETTESASRAA